MSFDVRLVGAAFVGDRLNCAVAVGVVAVSCGLKGAYDRVPAGTKQYLGQSQVACGHHLSSDVSRLCGPHFGVSAVHVQCGSVGSHDRVVGVAGSAQRGMTTVGRMGQHTGVSGFNDVDDRLGVKLHILNSQRVRGSLGFFDRRVQLSLQIGQDAHVRVGRPTDQQVPYVRHSGDWQGVAKHPVSGGSRRIGPFSLRTYRQCAVHGDEVAAVVVGGAAVEGVAHASVGADGQRSQIQRLGTVVGNQIRNVFHARVGRRDVRHRDGYAVAKTGAVGYYRGACSFRRAH
ncbi:MAG: hypothetical protein FI707_07845 [SAR202 cluster bacterium]|nr:hypothetical protein [SAR202 cluster bacterium]